MSRPGMDAITEMFARASERNKIRYKPFEKNYCQGFEDGLDGFVIHTPACPNYQDSACSGSNCIDYRSNCRWPAGLAAVR